MDLKIISSLGTEFEIVQQLPDHLIKHKILHATPYYINGPWGEILMQAISVEMGIAWDTWYNMFCDTCLMGISDKPLTEMHNALLNSFNCKMNKTKSFVNAEGKGKITHETSIENVASFTAGTFHTFDLHLINEKLADIANDHPTLYDLLNNAAKKKSANIEKAVNIKGKLETIIHQLINPYCAPGQISRYHNFKFEEILLGALWQIDGLLGKPKITAAMIDKAVEAEQYIRNNFGEVINYRKLSTHLGINTQYLKMAFKEHFGFTIDN